MSQESSGLVGKVENAVILAHGSDISDAIYRTVGEHLRTAAGEADDFRAVAAETTAGVLRAVDQLGGNVAEAVRFIASAVVRLAAERHGDVGAAARGFVEGAGREAAQLGAQAADIVLFATAAVTEAAGKIGGRIAAEVADALEEAPETPPGPARSGESSRVKTVALRQETLAAYAEYVSAVGGAMPRSAADDGAPFLWSQRSPDRASRVRKGQTIAHLSTGDRPLHVPEGLVHDWSGATFVPGATLGDALAVVQNYDHHHEIYRPDVVQSRLISQSGNVFEIFLRLLKKKIITVVLDTDHHVEYWPVSPTQWCCESCTTRVSEVEHPGKPDESQRPPDTGYGFLWRLSSFWRFEQRDGGVCVECRAVSLTRDVPKGLGWMIDPIVRKLPRDSLISTLDSTRRACGRTLSMPAEPSDS